MRHDDIVPAWEALGTRLDVDGANSRIWREGKGEPVVCLHGVPASSFVYRKLLPELATRGMEGIAFDFPGMWRGSAGRGSCSCSCIPSSAPSGPHRPGHR
ncbi:hypothetical protein [Pseudoxanthomonas mexicana]